MSKSGNRIYIRQIQNLLSSQYVAHIDQSDLLRVGEQEKQKVLMSRALAAMAVHHLAKIDPPQCGKLVVDESGDKGIDAFAFNTLEKTVYVIQSKFYFDGNGSIDTSSVLKLIEGFHCIVDEEIDRCGHKLQKLENYIREAADTIGAKYKLVFVYTGEGKLTKDQTQPLDKICKKFNATLKKGAEPILSWSAYGLSEIYSWLRNQGAGEPVDIDIDLLQWGEVNEPYAVYGQVKGGDIAQWWERYDRRIVDKNIRSFLGIGTDVNDGMIKTLCESPDRFWYYNNGLTIICSSIQRKTATPTREHAKFRATGVSIVNGAQTAATIAEAKRLRNADLTNVKVSVRLIEVGDMNESDFATEITKATNTQNKVTGRDFVALDPEQERIRQELHLEQVSYLVKVGELAGDASNVVTFDEAIVALACAMPDLSFAARAKRAVSELWQNIESPQSYYRRLFNATTSGAYVWRVVQCAREIERALKEERRSLSGRNHGFAVHGNRFITYCVFQELNRNILEGTGALSDEEKEMLCRITKEQLKLMLDTAKPEQLPGYPAVFFKNQDEQSELYAKMKKSSLNARSTKTRRVRLNIR